MGYNGRWIDSFNARVYDDNKRPGAKGKIILETPHIDYLFDRDQWREFKEKVNKI